MTSSHRRFFQLHVAVDGGEFEFAHTFADGAVEVAAAHAALDRHGEIALHVAVHRAGADFRVEVAGDFELDASVDGGEVERAGPIGAAEAREHGAVHGGGFRPLRRLHAHGAVHARDFGAAAQAGGFHLSVDRAADEAHVARHLDVEIHARAGVAVAVAVERL